MISCCSFASSNNEKIHINKKTIVRDQIDITISKIDNLLNESREEGKIQDEKQQLQFHITTQDIHNIQENIKHIYKSKLVRDYKPILTLQSIFHFRKNKSEQYCQYCCFCNCQTFQCPTYHGCDCNECGYGTHESWAYQYHDQDKHAIICCSLFCAGIQLYLCQWVVSPCLICHSNVWECDKAHNCECALYKRSENDKKLSEINNYVDAKDFIQWATSLKTSLILLKSYIDENKNQINSNNNIWEASAPPPPFSEIMK